MKLRWGLLTHSNYWGMQTSKVPMKLRWGLLTHSNYWGMQTSKIRRKRILKTCNPDIADKQELFQDAAPNLFGDGFELKMKERAEAVRVLHKGQSRQTQRQFFRGNRYPQAREVAVMDTRAAEHVIPQWATDLHSLKHFIKKAFRGRTSDSEEGKVGHHPERGPSELNSMYEYEYVIKNQFETYPSNYSFKTIRCKREDTRGVNGTFTLSRTSGSFSLFKGYG